MILLIEFSMFFFLIIEFIPILIWTVWIRTLIDQIYKFCIEWERNYKKKNSLTLLLKSLCYSLCPSSTYKAKNVPCWTMFEANKVSMIESNIFENASIETKESAFVHFFFIIFILRHWSIALYWLGSVIFMIDTSKKFKSVFNLFKTEELIWCNSRSLAQMRSKKFAPSTPDCFDFPREPNYDDCNLSYSLWKETTRIWNDHYYSKISLDIRSCHSS